MKIAAPRQPEQTAAIRVIPGEPTRFHVRSASRPSEYHMVDLAGNNGAGACDCIRFDCVCRPIIVKTANLPPSKRCRHLRAARELALNLTIRQYLAEHPETK